SYGSAPGPYALCWRSRRDSRRSVWKLLLAVGLAPLAHADKARQADQADQAMPAETLAPLMAGEFALQSGQLDEAARWYLDAARAAEGDVPLAERAKIGRASCRESAEGQRVAVDGQQKRNEPESGL